MKKQDLARGKALIANSRKFKKMVPSRWRNADNNEQAEQIIPRQRHRTKRRRRSSANLVDTSELQMALEPAVVRKMGPKEANCMSGNKKNVILAKFSTWMFVILLIEFLQLVGQQTEGEYIS